MPRLPTTRFLDYIHSEFVAFCTYAPLPQILWWQHDRAMQQVDRLKAANRKPGDRELDSAVGMLANLESQLRDAADLREFTRIGHSLFAFLSGLVGGIIALRFYAKRERRGAATL
jgi:hypothetical protein